MRSKLKFGLNRNNKAIIEGTIELSEDLRDVVAQQFREALKHTGSLVFYNTLLDGQSFYLTPYSAELEDMARMSGKLSLLQLENLSIAIENEKINRELHKQETHRDDEEIKDSDITIRGYLGKELQINKSFNKIKNAKNTSRGLMLDEIQMDVYLKSKQDILHLVDFLQSTIPCFEK